MTTTYETVAGTPANVDEQHEPRTIKRTNDDGSIYMMTEFQDGTFVAWTTCDKCRRQVSSCTCANGPTEPAYIERWRLERFTKSFTGRQLLPALPVTLKQKDRRINAVIRLLRSQGWTLTPPDVAEEALESAVAEEREPYDGDYSSLEECVAAGDHLTYVDEDGYCNYCGHQDSEDDDEFPDDPDNLSGMDLGEGDPTPQWQHDNEAVAQSVHSGMDSAIEALRARKQEEDNDDVGF